MHFAWSAFYFRKKISDCFKPTYSPRTGENGEPSLRIVNIPVDFTEADKEEVVVCTMARKGVSSQRAAVLIQAWYKGYLVRKTKPLVQLREIHEVKAKLKELQSDLSDVEFIKRAQHDPTARVWLNESVMGLFFKLDSIQGAHPFVREMRKGATREVVNFQDSIDALLSADRSSL